MSTKTEQRELTAEVPVPEDFLKTEENDDNNKDKEENDDNKDKEDEIK